MPDPNKDAGEKLQKLGERLRAGNAKQHPTQNLETVRTAVREQYEREQEGKRTKVVEPPNSPTDKNKDTPEPEPER